MSAAKANSTISPLELIARRFRAIAEPMQIRLLDRLRDGEATVGELSDAVGA